MKRKAIFFDIDGTLWGNSSVLPESASCAIREMKAAGHAVLICSGRSRGYIFKDDLLALGFDGFVSGGGAQVEVNGRLLLNYVAPPDALVRAVEVARACEYGPLLESNSGLYMERDEFTPTPYIDKLYQELGPRMKSLNAAYGRWMDVPKLSMIARGEPCSDKIVAALSNEWNLIVHTPEIIELTPLGLNKGTGLSLALEALGMAREDSIAFGDSANDLAMFGAAGLGIAMGNAAEALKAQADYVTTDLYDDGIWNAWQWLRRSCLA